MAIEFTTTAEDQLEAVRALLRQRFHLSTDSASLRPSLLAWKYYGGGREGFGSRSYVLTEAGRILAHAAVWPLQLRLQGETRSGITFFDWAASEQRRGIGLVLLKKVMALAPFVLVIGGGDATRQILPRAGFQHWADLPVYARVLNPIRQLRTRPRHTWKEPFRLSRNIGWAFVPLASDQSWRAELSLPDGETLSSVQERSGSIHTEQYLRFLTNCPTVSIRCLVLRKGGVPRGYSVISFAGGQGRIAEIRIASDEKQDWKAALSAIVKVLAREPEVCEVIAIGSIPILEEALRANGFHLRQHRPVMVLDSERKLAAEPVPQLGMLEDDASFLRDEAWPYLT